MTKVNLMLCLALCFCFQLALAQKILTVNNISGTIADYSTIQEAVNAANEGDYIYVQHSQTSYGNAKINKKLHLRGRSHSLSNYITKADIISFEKGSDGSTIQGFRARIDLLAQENETLENIEILNNYLNGFNLAGGATGARYINISIQGNVIDGSGRAAFVGGDFLINFVFSNNICMKEVVITNSPNIVVSNNIFNNTRTSFVNISHKGTFNILDCIFLSNSDSEELVELNADVGGKIVLENCITYNYNSKGKHLLSANNSELIELKNCLENTNPQFVKVSTTGNSIGNQGFNPDEDDLHLKPTAPISSAGVYGE